MDVVSTCPLPVASLLWQPQPSTWALTVVCRATITLLPGESTLAEVQEDPAEHDDHWNDDPDRSLRVAGDLVPMKPRADVTVVGHAFAPRGAPVQSLVAHLIVGELSKSIEVVGDRWFDGDGALHEGPPFSRMPITYERAAGGPGTVNPVGMTSTSNRYGRVALPNLQPPGILVSTLDDYIAPAGFGPIAPGWPTRRERLGRAATSGIAPDLKRPLPDDLDPQYFNHAPRDQQVQILRDRERLILEHLHPEHPRLVTDLPSVRPRATVERHGRSHPVPLRCDTLWIDTDRALCTLTWRAQVPLKGRDEPGRVVFTMDKPGQSQRIRASSELGRLQLRPPDPEVDTLVPTERAMPALPASKVLPFVASPPPGPGARSEEDKPRPSAAERTGLPFVASQPSAAGARSEEDKPRPSTAERTGLPFVASPPPPPPPPSPRTGAPYAMSPPAIPPPLPPAVPPPRPSQMPLDTVDGYPRPPAFDAGSAPMSAVYDADAIPRPSGPRPSLWSVPEAPAGAAASLTVGQLTAVPAKPVIPTPRPSVPAPPPTSSPGEGPAAASRRGSAETTNLTLIAPDASSGSTAAASVPAESARAAPKPEGKKALQLVYFEPESLPRLRRKPVFQPILAALEERPLDSELDDPSISRDPTAVEDRRDVFEVLARGEATDENGLEEALEQAVRDDGKFVPPFLLLAGELRLVFDDLAALRATLSLATPFASGDEGLKLAIADARELLGTPDLISPAGLAERFTARVVDAFRKARRQVAPTYLEDQVERALLEKRLYQRREVFGAPHLRALLTMANPARPWPVYLPESVARKLPMFARFAARLLVGAHLQEDQFETHPNALRALALARVVPIAGKTDKAAKAPGG